MPRTPDAETTHPPILKDGIISLILTIIISFCAHVACVRSGALELPLCWDSSYFLGNAIQIKRSVETGGLVGFADAWVNVSTAHAPLVPAVSALFMLAAGESRGVAFAIIPVFIFIFILSVMRVARRLHPAPGALATAGAGAAAFTAACNPIFLNVSHLYLFELPQAALSAAACWAMLASEKFTKFRECLILGFLCGLVTVSRLGAPMLLAGPVLVYLYYSLRREPSRVKIVNILIVAVLSLLIAATWHIPNWRHIVDYLHSVTYGDRAELYTVGGSSFSIEGAAGLLWGTVYDGAGLPALAFAGILYIYESTRRRKFVISATACAIGAAFILSFLAVVPASQVPGGILLVAILPAISILQIRAALLPENNRVAVVALLLTLIFPLHHLHALSFGFDPSNPPLPEGRGRVGNLTLWNHREVFLEVAGDATKTRRWDSMFREIADQIEAAGVPDSASVCMLIDHPFLQPHNIQLLSLARGRHWRITSFPLISTDAREREKKNIIKGLFSNDVIIIKTAGARPADRYESMAAYFADSLLTKEMTEGPAARFKRVGDNISVHDGSSLILYKRSPNVEWSTSRPTHLTGTEARFRYRDLTTNTGFSLKLHGTGYAHVNDFKWVEMAFEVPPVIIRNPGFGVQVLDREGKLVSIPQVTIDNLQLAARKPDDKFLIVRVPAETLIPPKIHERGFSLGVIVFDRDGHERFFADSKLPVRLDERSVVVTTFPPESEDKPRDAAMPLPPPILQ